ncbi:MAG TPA: sulfotransferase [Acidimicrobiales bacterium]|nr:sulfotransferase [Acidimicrobiales bacterium]
MSDHDFVFIGGLHRSGTSLLFQVLRDHPEVSGFRNTGVREDEGQHLQSTYLPANAFGGAGAFARDPKSHLVEVDAATAAAHRADLMASWGPHWDLTRRVLIEKSPPNLVRMRYLQSVFPGARFIVIVRHPITAALATKKWRRRQSLWSLVDHWVRAHAIAREDAAHLDHFLLLRYEDLVANPAATLGAVQQFVGLRPDDTLGAGAINPAASDAYAAKWAATARHPLGRFYARALVRRFGDDARRYGYDLGSPE